MTPVFADTFYFLALLNPDDDAHAEATAISNPLRWPILTTAWVLVEVADAMNQAEQRRRTVGFIERLRRDASVTILPPSQELFDLGFELYRDRSDKDWPLTDCISFAVMKARHIKAALTGDRHFEQAGFRALLR